MSTLPCTCIPRYVCRRFHWGFFLADQKQSKSPMIRENSVDQVFSSYLAMLFVTQSQTKMHMHVCKNIKYVTCFFFFLLHRRPVSSREQSGRTFCPLHPLLFSFLSPSHLPYPVPDFYLLTLFVCYHGLTIAKQCATTLPVLLTRTITMIRQHVALYLSSLTTLPINNPSLVCAGLMSYWLMIMFFCNNRY
jgi:hypothetical protein